jgi:hypothetical protein
VREEVELEDPVGDVVVGDVLCKVAEGLLKLFGENGNKRLATVKMVRIVPDPFDVVLPLLDSPVLPGLQLTPHGAEVHRVADDVKICRDIIAIRVDWFGKHGRDTKRLEAVENAKTPRLLIWTQRHWPPPATFSEVSLPAKN